MVAPYAASHPMGGHVPQMPQYAMGKCFWAPQFVLLALRTETASCGKSCTRQQGAGGDQTA
eukprot:4339053-Amphidinium_carterae.1